MKQLDNFIQKLDTIQQRYHWLGFPYAVIKKYGQDQSGQKAALLTYYGFLALFPLLLVLTTLTTIIAPHHSKLQQDIISSTTNYFPVLGKQLGASIHSLHKSGLALVTGLIFTFYGARGIANVFIQTANGIWGSTPASTNFIKSLTKSLGVVSLSGLGLVGASVATGLAASAGHGPLVKIFALVINVLILYGLFQLLLNISLPNSVSLKQTRSGAVSTAVGLVALQIIGSYLLKRQLKNLDALYSYFAVALSLLFWIYLQAQVLCYGIEIAAVHTLKLWPRSLTGKTMTAADKSIAQVNTSRK